MAKRLAKRLDGDARLPVLCSFGFALPRLVQQDSVIAQHFESRASLNRSSCWRSAVMRTRREFTSSTWSDTSILMSSSMVPHFTSLNLAGVSQRLVSHTPTLSCCLEYSLQLMPSAEASAAVLEAQLWHTLSTAFGTPLP